MARIVDPEEKRLQILSGALTVFRRSGLERSTIAQIAREAGIGKGTIYEYFASKEAIIQAVLELLLQELEAGVMSIAASPLPPREKLEAMIGVAAGMTEGDQADAVDVMFAFWAEAVQGEQTTTVETFYRLYAEWRELLGGILADGVADGSFRTDLDPRHLAAALIGVMDGVLFQWILDRNGVQYRAVLQSFTRAFLEGIIARPDSADSSSGLAVD